MDLFSTLILLVIVLVIFIVCREVMCWYWKINQTVIILNEINVKLNEIVNKIEMLHKK
jgi:hypothetical protein